MLFALDLERQDVQRQRRREGRLGRRGFITQQTGPDRLSHVNHQWTEQLKVGNFSVFPFIFQPEESGDRRLAQHHSGSQRQFQDQPLGAWAAGSAWSLPVGDLGLGRRADTARPPG